MYFILKLVIQDSGASQTLFANNPPGTVDTLQDSRSFYRNGGAFSVGYRHYFPNNLFLDFDSTYSFYSSGPGSNLNVALDVPNSANTRAEMSGYHNIYIFWRSNQAQLSVYVIKYFEPPSLKGL